MSEVDAVTEQRVLVVDDNLAFAETVAEGLSEFGWQACALGSAARALELIRAREFDALVTRFSAEQIAGRGRERPTWRA